MTKPERWSDEWIEQLWHSTSYNTGGTSLVIAFARAVAREAFEEACQIAAEYDDHVCFTEKVCDSKAGCAARFAIRARAKEVAGE